mmetsp:Transcript_11494/g.17020  ORF Transcript_11494/g.17020 Transcript_11494/m.17020 type:complete len:316 (+) Transcript_11494:54-1001(+)
MTVKGFTLYYVKESCLILIHFIVSLLNVLYTYSGCRKLIVDYIEPFLLQSLARQLHIPKHVAIIMDGNRRWAVHHSLKKQEGHVYGYQTLEQTLNRLQYIGVECVTAFSFSIENLKRPVEEQKALFELAEDKLQLMMHRKGIIEKHRIHVQILGNTELLPSNLQRVMHDVMDYSEKYNSKETSTSVPYGPLYDSKKTSMKSKTSGLTLNLCFAYTGTEDISRSLYRHLEQPSFSKINVKRINQALYTTSCPPIDMLIRTSGESRLSDFLGWQLTHSPAMLMFLDTMWPDFNVFSLLKCMFHFDHHYEQLHHKKKM